MKGKLKIILTIFIVLVVGGGAVAYYMWNKPRRSVQSEKGIEVTAAQLVKDYQANEQAGNQKYLDKAIQVTGTVTETSTNQEGQQTVMLASDDAFAGVYCTLKEKAEVTPGSTVVVKGFCSGMLSDVRLRQAVIVK